MAVCVSPLSEFERNLPTVKMCLLGHSNSTPPPPPPPKKKKREGERERKREKRQFNVTGKSIPLEWKTKGGGGGTR